MKNPSRQMLLRAACLAAVAAQMSPFLATPSLAAEVGDDTSAVIVATAAAADRLSVTVEWDASVEPDWFEVVVVDPFGTEIASQPHYSAPGEQTRVDFDAFFSTAQAAGFQFSTRVRDSQGQARSASHAFRLFFDCLAFDQPCDWQTVDGLTSNVVTIGEPLLAAFSVLETNDTTDLLADVLAAQPELAGQVMSFAAQLDRMEVLSPQSDCTCLWVHAFDVLPRGQALESAGPKPFDPTDPSDPGWMYRKVFGPGVTSSLSSQARTVGADSTPIPIGEVVEQRQVLKRMCFRVESLEPFDVPIGGDSPDPTFEWPKLTPCELDCLGKVRTKVTFKDLLSVGGRAKPIGGMSASAAIERELVLEDRTGATRGWIPLSNERHCEGSACGHPCEQSRSEDLSDELEVGSTAWAVARFTGQGAIDIKAPALQWAYAVAQFEVDQFTIEAKAYCTADEAVAEAHFAFPRTPETCLVNGQAMPAAACPCGELSIDPWEKELHRNE